MKNLSSFVARLSSLKLTAVLLVAFMLLTFWGVMAQVNAEAAGLQATVAVDRFFDSYVIWVLGVVPLPAFKSVALLACVNIVASMAVRMPCGWKNAISRPPLPASSRPAFRQEMIFSTLCA